MSTTPATRTPLVLTKREGSITRLTLARPDRRNALSPRMAEELTRALREAEADASIRVVVLRGAGGSFCSGGDLAPEAGDMQAERTPSSPAASQLDLMNRVYGALIRTLHEFPRPVIALVEGVAAGAGANLAFACDLVYASESARFAEIFVKRGLGLDCGGSWLLPRLIGLQRAKSLAFFGDWLDATTAREFGLVTEVYAEADFESATAERIETLATRAPLALTQIKQSLHQGAEIGLAEALAAEATTQAALGATEDVAEGFRAFLQKRDPEFQGR